VIAVAPFGLESHGSTSADHGMIARLASLRRM